MPVPSEVDELDLQIARFEEDLRRKKLKMTQLSNDVAEANNYVKRCRISRDACAETLNRLKKSDLVDLDTYKGLLKLYEDNGDLLIQHQVVASNRQREYISIKEMIPAVEAMIVIAKKKRASWGVVMPFKK